MAWLGSQAFAIAPVVRDLPDAVIGNDESVVTGAVPFIYRDFLNLASNTVASDDGPLSSLVWTYASAGRYSFNGVAPIIIGTDSPVSPPAAKVINSPANITTAGESNPDSNAFTPTIRDTTLSPIGGPNVDPGGSGIVASEVVTLFASDGTTAGMNDLIVYSDDGGTDRLSATPIPPPTTVYSANFLTGTNSWVSGTPVNSATLSTAGGLCISVTATNTNIGEWISPYNIFPTVDNAVYRFRLNMTTNQGTAGAGPLWDLLIQNLALDGSGNPTNGTDQAFSGDYFFLDNTGSANAIAGPSQGLNQFDVYYAVSAFRTQQWRSTTTGAFQPSLDPANDARLVLRVLDAENAGYGGESDSGQICMTSILIERFDFGNILEGNIVYQLDPITSGINGVSIDNLIARLSPGTAGSGSSNDFNTNPLTITPADANGWLTELTFVTPGDTTNPPVTDPGYGSGSSIIDNYPIVWQDNTLYMYTAMVNAPDATGETDGPDCLRLGFDAKTIELFGDSYILTGLTGKPGMPKTGAPQPYTMFWWSHNASLSTVPEAARLRWKLDVLNTTPSYDRPAGNTANQGGIHIDSIVVREATWPNL
jgi:hypothetical protein